MDQTNQIKQLFSSKLSIKTEEIKKIEQGVSTDVYNINPHSDNLFLRILPEVDSAFSPMVTAHKKALDLGIKVPSVVYYEDFSEIFDGKSFMIVNAIRGSNLQNSYIQNNEIFISAGEDIAKFNSIESEGYGWIERNQANAKDLKGSFQSVKEDLTQKLDKRLDVYSRKGMLTKNQIQKIYSLINKLDKVNGSKPILAHTDISYAHIFHDEKLYSGIIDFDDLRATNIYLDLAEASISLYKKNDFKNLLKGYMNIHKISKEELEYEFKITRLFWAIEKGYWVIELNPDPQSNRYYRTFLEDLMALS